MATSVDDGVIVEKHAVGEEALSQEQPDPFDRIEFWAVGWERGCPGRCCKWMGAGPLDVTPQC